MIRVACHSNYMIGSKEPFANGICFLLFANYFFLTFESPSAITQDLGSPTLLSVASFMGASVSFHSFLPAAPNVGHERSQRRGKVGGSLWSTGLGPVDEHVEPFGGLVVLRAQLQSLL